MNSFVTKSGTVTIGKIVGVHGLGGTCKVYPYADSLEVFHESRKIFVHTAGDENLATFEIDWCKAHHRVVLVSLKGVDDRTGAEKLVGREIVAPRDSLPVLENGTYYWHDLIGMGVYSINGTLLGRLEAVMQTGSNDVYVVKRPGGGPDDDILVPALKSVVLEIDLENRRIRVDLPEGL